MILAPSPLRIPEDPRNWTTWLHSFLADEVEEHASLDYKRGKALTLKGDGRRRTIEDISKDVSAMANAGGGVLIYGVAEKKNPHSKNIPAGYDTVANIDVTREQLDQIISANIIPPIDGVRIVPINAQGEPDDRTCFAVEIPQSSTAHQAKDGLFYRRRNTTTDPMSAYEIREVMSRSMWPDVEVKASFRYGENRQPGNINIRIKNVGAKTCNHYCINITLPFLINGRQVDCGNLGTIVSRTEKGFGGKVAIRNSDALALLPGMIIYKNLQIQGDVALRLTHEKPILENFAFLEVFADDMPKKTHWIDLTQVVCRPDMDEFEIYGP